MNKDDHRQLLPESVLRVLPLLRHLRIGAMARSSVSVMFWSGARLASQLAWVLLLARRLGASNYGTFSGIASLALAMSGFVGFGLSLRMYQDTVRNPLLFSARWRQALQASALTGVGLAALFFVMALAMFQTTDWPLLLAIALSELMLAPIVALVANAYAAHGWMGHAAATPVLLSFARIVAVLGLYLFPSTASVDTYGWLHVIATGAAAIALLWSSSRRLDIKQAHETLSWGDIKAGLGFSAVQASGLALGTLDKSFALRWGGDITAGRYVAAYRFVSVAVLPVDSLMMVAMPHLFRAGVKRDRASIPLLTALAMATGGYGIVMGTLVWWGQTWSHGCWEPASSALKPLCGCLPSMCLSIACVLWGATSCLASAGSGGASYAKCLPLSACLPSPHGAFLWRGSVVR